MMEDGMGWDGGEVRWMEGTEVGRTWWIGVVIM